MKGTGSVLLPASAHSWSRSPPGRLLLHRNPEEQFQRQSLSAQSWLQLYEDKRGRKLKVCSLQLLVLHSAAPLTKEILQNTLLFWGKSKDILYRFKAAFSPCQNKVIPVDRVGANCVQT